MDLELKIPWAERARIVNNNSEVKKYFEAYHIPCAESAIDFINRFCLTFDPRRKTDKILPLELFPKQEEYIKWLWDRYSTDTSGVVDKCRTAGASWVTISFFVYLFLFQKNSSLQVHTYKAEECHKLGDISTLLQKAVFIIEHLPPVFIQGVKTSHMYLKNERLGCDIAGSAGDNPGRGSRRTMIMTDEESFYQRAELIEAALSETSNCRISVSTHSGTTSLFYRKCQSTMAKFIFDWWDDPRNTQEWFDKKKQDAIDKGTLHIFKREIERNAAASLESVVVPSEWVSSAKQCDIKTTGKIIAALDPANEGGDLHGFVCVNGNIPVYAQESGEGDPGDATDVYFWKAVDLGATEFRYDPIGVGAGVKVRIKEIKAQCIKDREELEEQLIIVEKSEPDNIKLIESLKSSINRLNTALKIKITPWNAGGKVMRLNEEYRDGITNAEMFENAKAQAWWKVRDEFLNTYRYVNKKDDIDITSLIYIESTSDIMMNRLIEQISQPQFKNSASGKTLIDKKPKGTKSPGLGDAYIMCRAEVELEWQSWTAV